PSVVFDPTSEDWIELPGDFGHRHVRSSSDIQVPYLLPHRLQRRGAHRGIEATEHFRVPRAFDPPGSKAISEEVKCDVRMRSLSTVVFAVDDFGFGRMHLQAALRQAGLQLGHHGFRFSPAPTVHETIVSIPTPREVGVHPRHPAVEGVVQEEIGKYRADHATLRGAARPRYEFPVFPSALSAISRCRAPPIRTSRAFAPLS